MNSVTFDELFSRYNESENDTMKLLGVLQVSFYRNAAVKTFLENRELFLRTKILDKNFSPDSFELLALQEL